jgi:hypothetical protein
MSERPISVRQHADFVESTTLRDCWKRSIGNEAMRPGTVQFSTQGKPIPASHDMTTYRSPPSHCMPRKRKSLSLWRRIVLGYRARLWCDAMIDQSFAKKTERTFRRIAWDLDDMKRDLRKVFVELKRAIDESSSSP